jgi:hypothetical protein
MAGLFLPAPGAAVTGAIGSNPNGTAVMPMTGEAVTSGHRWGVSVAAAEPVSALFKVDLDWAVIWEDAVSHRKSCDLFTVRGASSGHLIERGIHDTARRF